MGAQGEATNPKAFTAFYLELQLLVPIAPTSLKLAELVSSTNTYTKYTQISSTMHKSARNYFLKFLF